MMQQLNTSMVSNLGGNQNKRRKCIVDIKDHKQIQIPGMSNAVDNFTFDYVGGEEVSQEEIFQVVGKPIVDQCLQGYNGSIFAYGQTGSGKTYTIQGLGFELGEQQDRSQRGLLPRCFEYLFNQVCKMKNMRLNSSRGGKKSARQSQNLPRIDDSVVDITFDIKCCYLEIYNEIIIDLLDPSQQKVNIRETQDKGIYADPCTEEPVNSIQDVYDLIQKGTRNRHIARTNMNNESSRSHAVFTATIKTATTSDDGEQIIKTSRFHIVDLAGSERCKDTGAEGQRLKEAGMINKSLTTLGAVIYDLSENSETKGKSKHIRYRDSKLTYLLKDALGGNSKTVMICNVNPHMEALKETRTTLQFAQRAKMIKNVAVINEENTSVKYWKEKYLNQLQLNRANTMPNKSSGNLQGTDICAKCKGYCDYQMQDDSSNKIDHELLKDAYENIKKLTSKLKEEVEKREHLELAYNKEIDDINKFKMSQNFIVKLKEDRITQLDQKLKNILQKNPNDVASIYIEQLNTSIHAYQQEITELKQQIQINPLLKQKNAQCAAFEQKIKEYERRLGVRDSNVSQEGGMTADLQSILNKVLENIDRAMLKLEQAAIQRKDQIDPDRMDIDMGAGRESALRTSFNGNFFHGDISTLTIRRENELANIKSHYEEQLEMLRQQLKSEQSKSQKLSSLLGKNAAIKNTQVSQNDDFYLLSSQMPANNIIFNTQQFLLQSQQNIAASTNEEGNQAMQLSSSNGANLNQTQIIEEMTGLLESFEFDNKQKDEAIKVLQDENEQNKKLIENLNQKYNLISKENIELETLRIKLEEQLQLLTQQNNELAQENQELNENLQNQEQLIDQCTEYKQQLKQLEEENESLQKTNDYYCNNAIPDLQMHLQTLERNVNQMQQEQTNLRQQNKQLQEFRGKDQQVRELQQQNAQLSEKYNQERENLIQFQQQIDQYYAQFEKLNNNIRCQQEQNEDLKQENARLKEEISELESEVQIQTQNAIELRNAIEHTEQCITQEAERLYGKEKELESLKQQFQCMQKEYEDEKKLLRSDRNKLELDKKSLEQALESKTLELQEEKGKVQRYKDMLDQHMESSQKAIETIQKYRQSNGDKYKEFDEQIKKQKQQNMELNEKLKQRFFEITELESKIQSLESIRDRMVKDDVSAKYRDLEREFVNIQSQLELKSNQVASVESQLQMEKDTTRRLQRQLEELNKMNDQLINGGDQSKFQHFSQIKSQSNKQAQQLMQIQQSYQQKKMESEKLEKRLADINAWIARFGDEIYKQFNINKNAHQIKCDINMQEYLQRLYEIIVQGCTNQKLQLETPNVAPSQQSEQNSGSGITDHDANFFLQYQDLKMTQLQQCAVPQKNQQSAAHPQRTINLAKMQAQQDQENLQTLSNQNNKGAQNLGFQIQHQVPNKFAVRQKTDKAGSAKNSSSFIINPSQIHLHPNSMGGGAQQTMLQNQLGVNKNQQQNPLLNMSSAASGAGSSGNMINKARDPSNNRMDIDN